MRAVIDQLVVFILILINGAESQPEVECLTSCGSRGAILRLEETVGGCCTGASAAGAFNIPGAGLAIDCAPCSDYQNIPGEIEFSFTPQTPMIGQLLVAECIVITETGLSNPLVNIAWLGPDSTIFISQQDIEFNPVTRNGAMVLEARLSLNLRQFSAQDIGEYSCIAAILSDSFPASQTTILRSVQIPTTVDISQISVPIYPIGESTDPVAGQPYTIDCIVGASGLTNEDIAWLGIEATTGRVSVGDVVQDGNGNSVRSLRFNPLSTEDSGPYICQSQNGSSVQTLTVNVPTPATVLTTTPPDPVSGQPLLIDCSSSVPESLQGLVRATLIGPDGSTLAVGNGANRARATLSIANATDADSGDYDCLVNIISPFLTSEGSPRPLQDSVVLFINISIPTDTPTVITPTDTPVTTPTDTPVTTPTDTPSVTTPTDTPVTTPTDTPVTTPTDTPVTTPTDTPVTTPPKTKPTFVYPTYPTYPTYPDPNVERPPPDSGSSTSQIRNCSPSCHTNGECVQTVANMFECRCKDGYQGNGVLCCINNMLIELLREQARDPSGLGENEDENDEDESESATTRRKKTKKKSKGGRRRGRRHKSRSRSRSSSRSRSRSSSRSGSSDGSRRSSRPCTKKNKSPRCREAESGSPPQQPSPASPGFEINLISVPEQCRTILAALVLEGL